MIADVLLEITSAWINKTFSYLIPENIKLEKGMRVIVPFGNKKLEGFVMNIKPYSKQEYELKYIIDTVDIEPVLNDELIDIGKYISNKCFCTLIKAYQTMLPVGYKASSKHINIKYTGIIKLGNYENIKLNNSQQKIVDYLKQNGSATKEKLNKISKSSVNTLLSKNIIIEEKKENYRLQEISSSIDKKVVLTNEQKKITEKIINSKKQFSPFLLHGVTGSGKTEIYLEVAEHIINKNKNVIILVPEISLTPQFIERFRSRFLNNIAVLHSGLSNGEKYDEWRRIKRGEVSIVIGARSAIFAPLSNIGLIIVDEEHSDTYKQDNTPKYNAIDIALCRAKTHKSILILGSATPSIESYTRAKMNIYTLLELTKRVNAKLPKVELVDMKEEIKKGNKYFSDIFKQKLQKCLNNNEQAIILLNRRGYTTTISCNECGFKITCPKCDIPLTYHKNGNYLLCHYCGYKTFKPNTCPSCNSKNINEYGLGTEKLEEIINKEFNNIKSIRMDVDTTTKKGSHKKIVNDFQSQKYNVLIGTQMISKGLNFENVTFVGVLNADSSLNIPDFRSAERTFSLLDQVAGRAGRGSLNGEVIMQGFNMDHYSILCASMHDYQTFYKKEMQIRKKLNYPPYYNLCLLKTSCKDELLLQKENNNIIKYLQKLNHDYLILGPSPSRIPKINNIYYYQILIKYKKIEQISNDLKVLYEQFFNKKVKLEIDINPYHI